MAYKGKLEITLVQGDLTHDTEVFGKMDPYGVFTYNTIIHKTEVHNDGGKKP